MTLSTRNILLRLLNHLPNLSAENKQLPQGAAQSPHTVEIGAAVRPTPEVGAAVRPTLYIWLLFLLLPLLSGSCRDADDAPGMGGTKLITVSRLNVSIQGMQSAAEEEMMTRNAAAVDAGAANTIDAKGYLSTEKKKFVEGDVLHFRVALTQDDWNNNNFQISNATLQKDGTTWLFDKPLILPQDATKTAKIEVFYDGKQDKYTFCNCNETIGPNDAAHGNYYAGYLEACNGTTDAQSGYTSYLDMLEANRDNSSSNFINSGITLTPNGTLTLTLRHSHTLVRISSITNLLEAEVETIEATIWESTTQVYSVLLSSSASSATHVAAAKSNAAPYDAIVGKKANGNSYYLQSFTVTFRGGRTAVIPVPDGNGGYGGISGSHGRKFYASSEDNGSRSFTYRFLLLPGSLSAVADDGNTSYTPRRDPAVPAGYIPIYTAEDLRKIGTNQPALVRDYLYTDAGTDAPLQFSLSARYILMNDIDLTPGTGPVAKDLRGIENVPEEELWTPKGDGATPFSGRFKGNGFTIRGMTICSNTYFIGLFGYTKGAVIYNLHMQDARVKNTNTNTTECSIGSLAGYCQYSTLSLCSATGCAVHGSSLSQHIGGLVGDNYYSTLTRCHATACTLFGEQSYAGGLVGYNLYTTLASCYATGCTDNNNRYFGGLAGCNIGSIYGCYATYSQETGTGTGSFGSLVGYNQKSAIASCYAINATGSTFGLVGQNDGTITACVSPFKNSHSTDSGYTGGYAPLTDDTALTTLSDYKDANNNSPFTAEGNLAVVRTILVNGTDQDLIGIDVGGGEDSDALATIPPGGLYVVQRQWTAQGIWGNSTVPTDPDNPTLSLPRINMQYNGKESHERAAPRPAFAL